MQRNSDGLVVNVVVWDGVTDFTLDDSTLVPANDHPVAWIGWRWDGTEFQPPPEPE